MKNKLKQNLLKYLAVGYLSTFLNVLLNLLLIKFLDTYALGRITLGKTVFQSFEFSHVGIRYGLDRVLPYHEDRPFKKDAYFTSSILFSGVSSIVFILFWFFYDINNALFYLIFSISGLVYTIITIYKIYFRASSDKIKFIKISAVISLLPILLQIIGLIIYAERGYLVAFLLSYLILAFVTYFYFEINLLFIRRKILINAFLHLLKNGYVLFFSSLVAFLSSSGDKFIIARYWGIENVGVFSVVMFFFSALAMFSLSYTEMIMNRIILSPTFKFISKHLIYSFTMTFILTIVAYFLIPYFVSAFIPNYINYIESIQLICMSILPFSIIPILNYFMHAIDKRMHLLYINLVCTFLYFIILYLILKDTEPNIKILIILKFWFNLALGSSNLIYFFIHSWKFRKVQNGI